MKIYLFLNRIHFSFLQVAIMRSSSDNRLLHHWLLHHWLLHHWLSLINHLRLLMLGITLGLLWLHKMYLLWLSWLRVCINWNWHTRLLRNHRISSSMTSSSFCNAETNQNKSENTSSNDQTNSKNFIVSFSFGLSFSNLFFSKLFLQLKLFQNNGCFTFLFYLFMFWFTMFGSMFFVFPLFLLSIFLSQLMLFFHNDIWFNGSQFIGGIGHINRLRGFLRLRNCEETCQNEEQYHTIFHGAREIKNDYIVEGFLMDQQLVLAYQQRFVIKMSPSVPKIEAIRTNP